MSNFLSLLDPFQPQNNLFYPGFYFINPNGILFKYFPFFEIFLKFRFQVSLYTCRLEIRKIFRLSRNSTKLF